MTKVLIADDEPNIVVSLEFMMKRAGLRSGGGARRAGGFGGDPGRAARAGVLLDAMMPGMSGFPDVCEAVRADAELRHTPIPMLTAKARDRHGPKGSGAGADAYVTKPFSTRDRLVERCGACWRPA